MPLKQKREDLSSPKHVGREGGDGFGRFVPLWAKEDGWGPGAGGGCENPVRAKAIFPGGVVVW